GHHGGHQAPEAADRCKNSCVTKDRANQFPTLLHESGGKLFCTSCSVVIKHKCKSSIDKHFVSAKKKWRAADEGHYQSSQINIFGYESNTYKMRTLYLLDTYQISTYLSDTYLGLSEYIPRSYEVCTQYIPGKYLVHTGYYLILT
uniref:Uncharacterized protein n=1 Tax=Kryptolebias marmoratus TaxID=37003 RepID=A0A3Q3FNI7_KRYMA